MLIVILIIAFLTNISITEGNSMQPNFNDKDLIFCLRLKMFNNKIKDYFIKRGSIISFEKNKSNINLLKRVIGINNDVININGYDILINNKKIIITSINKNFEYIENLLGKKYKIKLNKKEEYKHKINLETKIDKYEVFVLGDNRNISHDSRLSLNNIQYSSINGIYLFKIINLKKIINMSNYIKNKIYNYTNILKLKFKKILKLKKIS